jgi:hypothetical protein
MGKIKLEFISPKVLNNLKYGQFADKVVWGYNNIPDTGLTIDTDDWNIECIAIAKKGIITDWLVDEETYQFVLKGNDSADNYGEIQYPFAVAMLGQLVDRKDLIKYLDLLQNAFDGAKSRDYTEEKPQGENTNKKFDNNKQ